MFSCLPLIGSSRSLDASLPEKKPARVDSRSEHIVVANPSLPRSIDGRVKIIGRVKQDEKKCTVVRLPPIERGGREMVVLKASYIMTPRGPIISLLEEAYRDFLRGKLPEIGSMEFLAWLQEKFKLFKKGRYSEVEIDEMIRFFISEHFKARSYERVIGYSSLERAISDIFRSAACSRIIDPVNRVETYVWTIKLMKHFVIDFSKFTRVYAQVWKEADLFMTVRFVFNLDCVLDNWFSDPSKEPLIHDHVTAKLDEFDFHPSSRENIYRQIEELKRKRRGSIRLRTVLPSWPEFKVTMVSATDSFLSPKSLKAQEGFLKKIQKKI
jgi:hypothetical protein